MNELKQIDSLVEDTSKISSKASPQATFSGVKYSLHTFEVGKTSIQIGLDSTCAGKASGIISSLNQMFGDQIECMNSLGPMAKKRTDSLIKMLSAKDQPSLRSSTMAQIYNIGATDLTYKPLTFKCHDDRQVLGAYGIASEIFRNDFPHMDIVTNPDGTTDIKTLFHEMLHFLGYTHDGKTTEMAYACDFGCGMRPLQDVDPSIKSALNICANEYKISDPKYLENFYPFRKGNALERSVQEPMK